MKYLVWSLSVVLLACTQMQVEPTLPPTNQCIIDWEKVSTLNADPIDSLDCSCGLGLGCQENWGNTYHLEDPEFNPNNNSEFAYLRNPVDGTSCNLEIRAFNLCTGEDRLISDGACYSLSWNKDDWLLFTGTDRQVWKVKSNGDSLTSLNFKGSFNNYPTWNPSGTKFLFFPRLTSSRKAYISDPDGQIIDSIPKLNLVSAVEWVKEDTIIGLMSSRNSIGPFVYTISTAELRQIDQIDASFTNDSVILSTAFLESENAILWQTHSIIAKTNISTGNRTLIKAGGGLRKSQMYFSMTLSKDESLLLIERRDYVQETTCSTSVSQPIYGMYLEDLIERKVSIP